MKTLLERECPNCGQGYRGQISTHRCAGEVRTGRSVVRYLKGAERQIKWWMSYADRLTRSEREWYANGELRDGDLHRPIIRPVEPRFKEGQWLNALPTRLKGGSLRVRIAKKVVREDDWWYEIDLVEDFRTSPVSIKAKGGPEPTTIAFGEPDERTPNPPEPEGMTEDDYKRLGQLDEKRRLKAWQEERPRLEESIARLREAGVEDRVLERRLAAIQKRFLNAA